MMTPEESSEAIKAVSLMLLLEMMPQYMEMYGTQSKEEDVNSVVELSQKMAARHVLMNA